MDEQYKIDDDAIDSGDIYYIISPVLNMVNTDNEENYLHDLE